MAGATPTVANIGLIRPEPRPVPTADIPQAVRPAPRPAAQSPGADVAVTSVRPVARPGSAAPVEAAPSGTLAVAEPPFRPPMRPTRADPIETVEAVAEPAAPPQEVVTAPETGAITPPPALPSVIVDAVEALPDGPETAMPTPPQPGPETVTAPELEAPEITTQTLDVAENTPPDPLQQTRPLPRPARAPVEVAAPAEPLPEATPDPVQTLPETGPETGPETAETADPPDPAAPVEVADAPDPLLQEARPTPRPERAPDAPSETLQIAAARPLARPASLVIQPAIPLREPAPVIVNPAPPPQGPEYVDVVMIGDSITAGGRWSSRFPGVSIANRGVSGDTALKILGRMDGILATQPRRALLMFGINDIYNGVPVDRIVGRYDRIVTMLQDRGIDVVIQSTLACSGPVCGAKLGKVYALNRKLRDLARRHNVPFIDINRTLSDTTGLKRALSHDGVHLNGEGYSRWYAVLGPYIERA